MDVPSGLIQPVEPTHPEFVQAREKANTTAEAFIASPLEILGKLITEIEGMHIADRFSRTRKMSENVGNDSTVNPNMNMTEEEYKREQLLRAVENLRNSLFILAGGLRDIIMDAEATKLD